MNSTYLKFAAAALLFLLWTALVCTGHADPGLIDAIKYALGSLGLYHAATSLQGNEQLSMLLQSLNRNAPAESTAPPPVVVNVPSKPAPKEPQ